jgi:hypothetical protein
MTACITRRCLDQSALLESWEPRPRLYISACRPNMVAHWFHDHSGNGNDNEQLRLSLHACKSIRRFARRSGLTRDWRLYPERDLDAACRFPAKTGEADPRVARLEVDGVGNLTRKFGAAS